jgi:hypothetical protein
MKTQSHRRGGVQHESSCVDTVNQTLASFRNPGDIACAAASWYVHAVKPLPWGARELCVVV